MNLPEKFTVKNTCNKQVFEVIRNEGAYAVFPVDNLGNWGGFCRESVESFIERGLWEITEETKPSLLEKLKQLTIDTSTNVFIVNGQYEVYFDEFSNPAKASSEEELEKIIDAILLLNKAVNGEE